MKQRQSTQRKKYCIAMASLTAFVLLAPPSTLRPQSRQANGGPQATPTFQTRLNTPVRIFVSEGRGLAENLVSLAYQYQLPMGLEYVDREAIRRPLNLRLEGKSVPEVLLALVSQLPEYGVSLSGGIVQLFSTRARRDPSNLLNVVIDDFEVKDMDPQEVSAAVFEALSQ